MEAIHKKIFKKGSKTYFTSSVFFPKKIKKAVYKLYAFVRVADDFIDQTPPDIQSFESFVKKYKEKDLSDPIIKGFYEVKDKYRIQDNEVQAFLNAMKSDSRDEVCYKTYEELQEYMYGSAEVIGIMMSRIMGLPKESFPYAKKLGESMQYINFIRDIQEDNELQRQYIPQEIQKSYNIKSLLKPTNKEQEERFSLMISKEILRYFDIVKKAEKGFYYIPYRYLVPIKTASDMYSWTAKIIQKNPLIVFEKKVKPSKLKIISALLLNIITCIRYYERNTRPLSKNT